MQSATAEGRSGDRVSIQDAELAPYTAQALLDMLGEYLRQYPEMADEPVEIEHENGILDPLQVMCVEIPGTGRIHLIVDVMP